MVKQLIAILILSSIVLAACGGNKQGDDGGTAVNTVAEAAYQDVRAKRNVMDSPGEKLAVTKAFLAAYPESRNTADAIDAVYYYQGTELGDRTGALTYAETARARIDDPAIGREVDRLLIGYYGEAGMTAKMVERANRVAESGPLDFDDHWKVIEGATVAGDWTLARDYCSRARSLTNATAVRAEYPSRELSDDEVEEIVGQRTGMLMARDGWAKANLGMIDEALADFAEADGMLPRYYFGLPEYELNVYWGKALIMKGDFAEAIDRLATQGLIMRNEEALAKLKEAYVGMHGSQSGYGEYIDQLHRRIARSLDEFEMADYKGRRHRFSDLRGEVTLVTLWYPT